MHSYLLKLSGLLQFLPYSWSVYNWNPKATTVQYILQHGGWVGSMIIELNSFFQINIMDIAPSHAFCFFRQFFLALLAVPAQAEYYEASIRDFQGGRLGQNVWLLFMICLVETFVNVKYMWHSQKMMMRVVNPPTPVIAAWSGFSVIQLTYVITHSFTAKRGRYPTWMRWLKPASFLPFLLLFQYYAY